MAFRELTMIDVREVLRRHQAQQRQRQIARETGMDRKTVRRYVEAAESVGLTADAPVDDATVHAVAQRVQGRETPAPSKPRQVLQEHKARIKDWLEATPPLRLTKVHTLLQRRGVSVSYATLRRFAMAELGWRKRVTVRLVDPPPGQEAQADFGLMGVMRCPDGKDRKLWALIVTLSCSRLGFVWPTFTQTVEDVCEGLDAAWGFFEGIVERLIVDNLKPAITKAHALSPQLNPSFSDYAQERGLFIDAARVRRPQDKARVENQVAYVRESWFAGERFVSLDDARRSAQRWCSEVAGKRIHGTTHKRPLEHFEQLEKAALQPPPRAPYDVPTWSTAKVQPDHHAQVDRALYSLPTRYIGAKLQVRLDKRMVRLYLGTELVKVHLRQPPGGRSTDPADYPKHKATYALRDIDKLIAEARSHGSAVGTVAEQILAQTQTWRHMRHVYTLLRLCKRFGSTRVDEACQRAVAFEVFDADRIGKLVKSAHKQHEAAVAGGVVIPIEPRFARAQHAFVTRENREGDA